MVPMRPSLARGALARRAVAGAGLLAVGLAGAGRVAAHGQVPAEPPSVLGIVAGWTFEPAVVLPLALAVIVWLRLVGRVDRAHPANPVPRRRTVAFLAGLAVIAVALLSGIDTWDTTLFSIHMVQHLLLTLVAAPLIALGAPITLLLRAATPDVRRRLILPILHSRIVRIVSFPVVAWLLFAGVMWGTHFSPLFDASLENPLIHDLEHALYLAAGLLFWWPAVGLDPSPWRMPHPVRAMYVFLQMPQNTFLAVTILNSSVVLYQHYATLARAWGPSVLDDQQMAGGIMWISGDILFLVALAAILAGWMAHEQARAGDVDRRVDRERDALRVREARLAERLANEREGR
jgi:putative copper resistance protein D